jgi:putative tryptophan/tyrosine transport system substrate-binding protein
MRRIGVVVVSLILFAAPLGAEGRQTGKVFRIGVLFNASPTENPSVSAFDEGLRELGYIEGKNIVIERRYAKGKVELFPDLAAELVRLKVDVIVAAINPAVAAAQRVTTTIPIVMVLATDPVGVGFVASLARPGGNITGLSSQSKELQGKAIQLLKEAAPTMSRTAYGTCRLGSAAHG